MMQKLLHHWDTWWCRKAPPHALAIVRIAFGLFLLLYIGLMAPDVPMRFSASALTLPAYDWISLPPVWLAWLLYTLFIVALVSFTLGAAMRLSGSVAFLLYVYHWAINLHLFPTSFDRLFLLILAVLTCSGADRAFSLRMRRTHGSFFALEPQSILAQRLLAVQISAVYLGVGWQKMVLPAWQDGRVLFASLIGPWGTRLAYALMTLHLPPRVYDWLVSSVLFFEFFMPFGLWIPRVRWIFFVWGLLFHLLIALLLGIWWFLILIPSYILFFPPEDVYIFLQKQFPGKIK